MQPHTLQPFPYNFLLTLPLRIVTIDLVKLRLTAPTCLGACPRLAGETTLKPHRCRGWRGRSSPKQQTQEKGSRAIAPSAALNASCREPRKGEHHFHKSLPLSGPFYLMITYSPCSLTRGRTKGAIGETEFIKVEKKKNTDSQG